MMRRRDALKAFTGLTIAALTLPLGLGFPLGSLGCNREDEVPPPTDPVFTHGIASGDPLPNGVILWTRVSATGPVTGRWDVAKDVMFANIVASGSFAANADRDYTAKIDVTGLEPATTYYYRFFALNHTSLTGRTRTASLDATQLRFAVVSCASLPHGYFHVYRAIAERSDIDAVIHLGDYIYEYADGDYGTVRDSEPKHALQTLTDYRQRYQQYRRDPDLQEAHRQHPFICIWDDHEFVDNAWKDGATGDNSAIGSWSDHRLAAATAYSEWIPIRDQPGGKIWRSFSYGSLAELVFLDTRIWGRDQQGAQDDPRVVDPNRQILGADQEAWLAERLHTTTAQWKIVCQQVMMMEVPTYFRDDGWDDYPAARSRFYDVLEKAPAGPIKDVVVLSGDVHSSWGADLARFPSDPTLYDSETGRGSLAVEMIAPAITSPGEKDDKTGDMFTSKAAWIKYAELQKRGYILFDINAQRARGSWFHIDDVDDKINGPLLFVAGLATYTGESHLRSEPDAPELIEGPVLAPTSVSTTT